MAYRYAYPRPALTVDVVGLHVAEGRVRVLLIRRGRPPFAGSWALPGGFVDEEERLEAAAKRELLEETAVRAPARLCLLGVYDDPDRDPRGRTIGVVYIGVWGGRLPRARAGDDAAAVSWHPLWRPPPLAFDHRRVLADARARLADWSVRPAELRRRLLPRSGPAALRALARAIAAR